MNNIMLQGTMSGVGKSLLTAGLCRIFKEDGYSPAPFKSQNMALNSFITNEGLEMGRAQVTQAEAAGIEPSVRMNPILLKPTSDVGSQVIVNGEVLKNMSARDYFKYKTSLIPEIKKAYDSLNAEYSPIVIEGAGSPAEINLKSNDIVNMGLAQMLDAPVVLIGDIDRGGVFAQLLGTMMLLEEDERKRVKGLIINKFRGDVSLLDSGISFLEEKCGVPVLGVMPYTKLDLPDEDSLSERFEKRGIEAVDIVVIRFPRISNFSDFDVFEGIANVSLRYISSVEEFGEPDLVILPGSKNTIEDLKWFRECGLEAKVMRHSERHPVFGICGGYQMLGERIADPEGMESGGEIRGMGLLPIETIMGKDKVRTRTEGEFGGLSGIFSSLNGLRYEGYEIHMGQSGEQYCSRNNVYGSYVHGVFDAAEIAGTMIRTLAEVKGICLDNVSVKSDRERREESYAELSKVMRANIDINMLYDIVFEH